MYWDGGLDVVEIWKRGRRPLAQVLSQYDWPGDGIYLGNVVFDAEDTTSSRYLRPMRSLPRQTTRPASKNSIITLFVVLVPSLFTFRAYQFSLPLKQLFQVDISVFSHDHYDDM